MATLAAAKQVKKGNNSFIKIEKLSKLYTSGNKTLHAVNNISLGFSKGEMVTILGPSGSGKSTLLNIIDGF